MDLSSVKKSFLFIWYMNEFLVYMVHEQYCTILQKKIFFQQSQDI